MVSLCKTMPNDNDQLYGETCCVCVCVFFFFNELIHVRLSNAKKKKKY